MTTVGSLCTGYGGIEMGLALAGVDVDLRWVAETEPTLSAMHAVPNLGDITLVDWTTVEPVDLLTAGFPCQPTSAAGRRLGDDDPRWLWPAVHDAVKHLRPARFLVENVRNLVSYDKGRLWSGILDDLVGLGYGVRWLTLGACHVGAAHHRHRVFLLARAGGWFGPDVARVPTSTCGAKHGTVLPTPQATDGDGGAKRVPESRTHRGTDHGARLRDVAAALLPTPTARDGDAKGRGEGDAKYWAARAEHRTNGLPLGAEVALLPTPTVGDSRNTRNATAGRSAPDERPSRSKGTTPSDVAHAASQLLPTPRATDGVNGGPSQRGRRGDLAMPSAVQPEHWGRFAEAVERHAALYGDPPAPTEPNRNGAPRLSPSFAEWLMCLPPGHVTSRLDRVPALRAIGNGVCPPQLAAAWRLLNG